MPIRFIGRVKLNMATKVCYNKTLLALMFIYSLTSQHLIPSLVQQRDRQFNTLERWLYDVPGCKSNF